MVKKEKNIRSKCRNFEFMWQRYCFCGIKYSIKWINLSLFPDRRAVCVGAPGCIHPTAGLRGPECRATNLFVISLPGMASAAAVSCFFCYCYVLYCIVLYCIVGFSGFLYIRKALLINGENWMFGFGFSAFLFVCFSGGFSVLKRVSSIARQVVFWGLFFASQCFLFLISVCK